MKFNQLAILVICGTGLAACGGSSISDAIDNLVDEKSQEHIKPITNGPISGGAVSKELQVQAGPSKNILIIEGKTYTLSELEKSQEWEEFAEQKGLRYASYGHLHKKGIKPITFYQGEFSKEIPATGKAIYKGNATQLNIENKDVKEPILMLSSFNVDFANKKLSGSISPIKPGAGKPIELEAKIKGNTFFSPRPKDGVFTRGGFYGPDAAELSGVYVNEEIGGAFGAQKIDK